jgi:hypothetical protein
MPSPAGLTRGSMDRRVIPGLRPGDGDDGSGRVNLIDAQARLGPLLLPLPLLLQPLHIGDVALDILRRLGVGVAERLCDRGHIGLRPRGKMVVDDLEELEA